MVAAAPLAREFPRLPRADLALQQAAALRGGMPLTLLAGDRTKTPTETLGLAPGELVQVKDVEDIKDTLDKNQKNRGLYFDQEMLPFCGRTYRVRSQVSRIIEEKTGRLITIPGSCVILDGVYYTGRYHLSCPRAIFSYWREIWLKRPEPSDIPTQPVSAPPDALPSKHRPGLPTLHQ